MSLYEKINLFLPVEISTFKRSYGSICVLRTSDGKNTIIPKKVSLSLKRTANILKVKPTFSDTYNIPYIGILIDQCDWVLYKDKEEIITSDCKDYIKFQKILNSILPLILLEVKKIAKDTIAMKFENNYFLFMTGYSDGLNDAMCVFELDYRSSVVSYSQNCGFYSNRSNWSYLFHSLIIPS